MFINVYGILFSLQVTGLYMESSRINMRLLSTFLIKKAEKHKLCSLYLTAIFYIRGCGLYFTV